MSFFPKQPSSRANNTQTIAFDASTSAKNAFGPETYQVRMVADAACCYRIGDGNQTATTSDVYLPADTIEHLIVSPGQRIAVIKVRETAGTFWLTEMS